MPRREEVETIGGSTNRRRTPRLLVVLVAAAFAAVPTTAAQAANKAPTACFTQTPAGPQSGDSVTFNSACSSDPDGTIASRAWDLDNDGSFDDGTGSTASKVFAAPGTYTVRLRVVDNGGASKTVSNPVTIANRAPAAAFTTSPAAPTTGQTVTFTSTSTDPDGTIASQGWDLDNNGAYTDATTASASRSFATAGTYTVGLRVVDDKGAANVTTRTVTVANRPPASSFWIAPAGPTTGETVTFGSSATDPDGTIASQGWDLDNNGTYTDATTAQATRSFAKAGTYTIKLRVVDNNGAENIATRTVTVSNRAPTAAFSADPLAPLTGQAVTFTSTSVDPDGTIAKQAWDLDNDGQFDDDFTPTATMTWSTPGTYTVRLAVLDDNNAFAIATKTVTVANRPPLAAFAFAPDNPAVGDTVTMTSSSYDGDGTIAKQAWDLNDDGVFDDATGDTASTTFTTPGTHPVALKVTDDRGDSTIATQTVTVRDLPAPVTSTDTEPPGTVFDNTTPTIPDPTTPAVPSAPVLRWIDPFPVVRIRGRTSPTGARVTLLSVKGPKGAHAVVRCAGRGCPTRLQSKAIKTATGKAIGTSRFDRMERDLRSGVVLQVLVTQKGRIGKYTRFTIRRKAAPKRSDRCLMPGSTRPVKCPVAK
ncbi:MAG: hypothetical protein QOJ07_3903 [Thermoleophilaceae bacterium]|nr:hypothetical protein [Thermoleophilaceae bacterium]